jgi:tetratricopeptide (TPR) repeat protein
MKLGLVLALALVLAWPACKASDADLERLTQAPLSDADWRTLVAQRGSDPAFMARAYRVGCMQRIQASTPAGMVANAAVNAEANAAAIRLGMVLAEQLASAADIAGLLLCRGRLAQAAGQLNKAEADFSAAIEQATKVKDLDLQTLSTALRGELRHSKGDLLNARKDLQAAQQLSSAAAQDYALNALGNFYRDTRIGQYEKALDIYRRLLPRFEARKAWQSLANTRFNLALAYQGLERKQEALSAFTEAQASFESIQDLRGTAHAKINRADVLLDLNQAAMALELLDQALLDLKGMPDPDQDFMAHLARASALRALGRLAEAKTALALARQANPLAAKPLAQAQLEEESAQLAALAGQWQAAFAARTAQLKWVKALEVQQAEARVAHLKAEFESERQETANQQLQLQAAAAEQLQRLRIALIVVAGVGFLGCSALWWRRAPSAATGEV